MKTVLKLTLEDAKKILVACEREAIKIGVDMDIAIVDDGGHLISFCRMDNARITSINVSIDKAFTAAGARRATSEYAEGIKNGVAFGIHTSHFGRFCVVGGGVPIFVKNQIVGAVGCSSGTPEQDIKVAQAGVDVIENI